MGRPLIKANVSLVSLDIGRRLLTAGLTSRYGHGGRNPVFYVRDASTPYREEPALIDIRMGARGDFSQANVVVRDAEGHNRRLDWIVRDCLRKKSPHWISEPGTRVYTLVNY